MKNIIVSTVLASSIFLGGCGLFHSNSPSNGTAKEVINAMAMATGILDSVCAVTAKELGDADLAAKCADAYTRTRDKLQAAQLALANEDKSFVCSVKIAYSALQDFADVVRVRTGKVPEAVTVALAIAHGIGDQCTE